MICDTIIRTDPDGRKFYRPKRAFKSLDDAISQAKKLNADDGQEIKLVAYKCKHCQMFHIGRSGKPVTDKERARFKQAVRDMSVTILGRIKLDQSY